MSDAPRRAPVGKVPVLDCTLASWRFLAAHWRQLLPAALIVAIISGIAPVLLSAAGAVTQGGLFVASGIQIVTNTIFSAMVLRKSMRGEFHAPVGLAFGQDEARLLGVTALVGVLFLPFVLLFGFAFMSVAIGQAQLTPQDIEAMQNDPAAVNQLLYSAMRSPPGIVLCSIGFAAFAIVYARLSMTGAATIGEKKIVFLQTWGWSRGNVLRVVAAVLMTWLPAVIFNVLLAEVLRGVIPPDGGALVIGALSVFLTLVALLVMTPFTVLGAELYRGLRPPGFVAK